MFIWFSKVHPLVPFDGDDWGHLSFARRAVPELTQWNPAKLFPEIFMSMTCTIAAFTIAPITGDYIGAITIMSAFVTSGFITVYIHCFSECLKRIFKVSSNHSVLIEALFLILHFLILRQGDSDNTYLLYCIDLNCYYNYLLPALLNASLVLFMIKNDKKFKTKEISKQINSSRLSFAPPEYMEKFLDITPGSASVMGLMNDQDNEVTLLVDEDVLAAEYFGCHPCINTSSMRLKVEDVFGKFLKAVHHEYISVTLVGED